MLPTLRLAFADFWPRFKPRENYFVRLLSEAYQLEFCDAPDLLIYSCFGKSHRNYRCRKIFFTGENTRPNFRECDFALTFDHIGRPEHYRLPLYGWYGDPAALVKRNVNPEEILRSKTRFCNFVFSNRKGHMRNRFFELLSKYKRVDSGGRWLNNIGGPIADKQAFLRDYKFTIAFENGSHPGYTTEKLVQPMFENSLPIYWGNPLVHLDFNTRSFVSYFDHGNLSDLVDRVIEIDRDDALYMKYFSEPWYHNNQVNHFVRPENVLRFLKRAIEGDAPAAESDPWPIVLRMNSWSLKRRAA